MLVHVSSCYMKQKQAQRNLLRRSLRDPPFSLPSPNMHKHTFTWSALIKIRAIRYSRNTQDCTGAPRAEMLNASSVIWRKHLHFLLIQKTKVHCHPFTHYGYSLFNNLLAQTNQPTNTPTNQLPSQGYQDRLSTTNKSSVYMTCNKYGSFGLENVSGIQITCVWTAVCV